MTAASKSASDDGMIFAASSFMTIPLLFVFMSAVVGLKPAFSLSVIRPAAARTFIALPPFVTSLGIATAAPFFSSDTDFTFEEWKERGTGAFGSTGR